MTDNGEKSNDYKAKYDRMIGLLAAAEQENDSLASKLATVKRHVNLLKLERTLLISKYNQMKTGRVTVAGKRKRGKAGEIDFEEDGNSFVSEEEDVETFEVPSRPTKTTPTKSAPGPRKPTTAYNLFIKEKKLTSDKTLTELTKSLKPAWNDMSDLQKAVRLFKEWTFKDSFD
jgi:hypothetical protein